MFIDRSMLHVTHTHTGNVIAFHLQVGVYEFGDKVHGVLSCIYVY